MLSILQHIDTELLLLINGWHAAWLDQFMYSFSGRWVWVPMYVSLAFILLRREGWRRGGIYLLAIGLTILMADQVCATLIRPMVGRMRPANPANPLSDMIHIVNGYRGGQYGFPSCHGTNSVALAVFMSLIIRRRSFVCLIWTWALINCYTRMYLGVHYPGDLLVGGLIGGVVAVGMYKGGRRLIDRLDVAATVESAPASRLTAPLLPAVFAMTIIAIIIVN